MASTLIISGPISGWGGTETWGITKTGAGTLILTASNIYTGTTTVSNGTLQLGDGTPGDDGSLAGPISIGSSGALVYNMNGSTTASSVISGNGSLTKYGTGTLTLTANNTYGGGATVNSGKLVLWSNGSPIVPANSNLTINAGTVSTQGPSYVAIEDTSGGTVTINAGGLLSADSPSGYNLQYLYNLVLNGGTLGATYGGGSTTGNFRAMNSITASGNVTSLISAELALGSATNAAIPIDVDPAASSLVISGSIISFESSTSGITKTGAGTMILTGNNTYTGPDDDQRRRNTIRSARRDSTTGRRRVGRPRTSPSPPGPCLP